MPNENNFTLKDLAAGGLRFGNIAKLYYALCGEALPRQLDLIHAWFPGMIIAEEPSDGNSKVPAEYADREYMIHAVRYKGRLYSGGSTRVSQICGRLTGTAAGNKEKERKTAELIQKHAAELFINDMELTPRLKENAAELFRQMPGGGQEKMRAALHELVYDLAADRRAADDYDLRAEPFAMENETFDSVIYNAAYQLNLGTFSGLVNAYLWLLTGSLLRNETGRVLHLYDSSFIAIRREMSENGELRDKLDNLFEHERYYYTFDGDDLDNRFPGVEWYCDSCGAHLNEQAGFDDHLPEWKCTSCGYVNRLDISEIYDNEEDWQNRVNAADPDKFEDAVERRRREIQKGSCREK